MCKNCKYCTKLVIKDQIKSKYLKMYLLLKPLLICHLNSFLRLFWVLFIHGDRQIICQVYTRSARHKSSRPEVFCKKVLLKFRKIHRKTSVPESLFNKVAGLRP